MTETKIVNLKAEKCKCGDRYCFINASADVNVNADLNVNLYLNAEIKKGVILNINKFLSSFVRCYSACYKIAVTVMIKICRNATSA